MLHLYMRMRSNADARSLQVGYANFQQGFHGMVDPHRRAPCRNREVRRMISASTASGDPKFLWTPDACPCGGIV
jgi:hypothetical protein